MHNETGQEVHQNYTVFLKKFLFGSNGPFWAQKWWILRTLDLLLGFLHSGRGNEVDQNYSKDFSKKFLFKAIGSFLTQKMTSDRQMVQKWWVSYLWICFREFFLIFTVKGAKNCMEITLIVFPERVFFGTNRSFLAQEWCILIYLHLLWGLFFKFCTMKGGQGVKESYIKGFSEQVHVLVNGPFWAQNWCIVVTQDFNFTEWGGPKGTWKLH